MATTTIYVTGAGTYAEFDTASPAVAHYLNVDEESQDGATTYLRTNTANDRELYTMGDVSLPAGSVITNVRVYVVCGDMGTHGAKLAIGLRTLSTDYWGADFYVVIGWNDHYVDYAVNPNTGAAWTEAQVNAMECGYKATVAGGPYDPPMVTQVRAVVTYDNPAVLDQEHFRVKSDTGAINATDWAAAEDANFFGVDVATNLRLRILVANTGGSAGSIARRLEYKEDAGAWTQIASGSGNVRLAASSNFADGDATTSQLTAVGTFTAGQGKDTGSDTSSISLAAAYCVEDEWCIAFQAAAAGHSYQFRVTNAGVALSTYTVTPTIAPYIYQEIGGYQVFDADKYSGASTYFQATIRTGSATYPAKALLWDITASAPVADSVVTSSSTSLSRQRSAAITLTDGHEYVAKIGVAKGGAVYTPRTSYTP